MDGNDYRYVKCRATCKTFVQGGFCDFDGVLKGLSKEELNNCYEYSTQPYGLCNDYISKGEVELYEEWLAVCAERYIGNNKPYAEFMDKLRNSL
jgi:hypothetical protein